MSLPTAAVSEAKRRSRSRSRSRGKPGPGLGCVGKCREIPYCTLAVLCARSSFALLRVRRGCWLLFCINQFFYEHVGLICGSARDQQLREREARGALIRHATAHAVRLLGRA